MLIVATKLVKMLTYDKEPHPQYDSSDIDRLHEKLEPLRQLYHSAPMATKL